MLLLCRAILWLAASVDIATMGPPAGLDSPPPPPARAGSPFRMDITPVRTNQVNLFFSPAQDDDEDAAEGTYVRKAGQQVPEVYTRTARPVIDEDDESEEERPADPPSKRQRTSGPVPSSATAPQNAAARLAASRRALDPTSALSLFDDDPQDDPAASAAQYPGGSGDTFDPLKGPAGMMSGTAPGADGDATDKPKRTRPKLDAERYASFPF